MSTEILLVEDNPADALLLIEALDGIGWATRLTQVRTGLGALEYLRRKGRADPAGLPELILLDLNLPLLNGLEVASELRKDPRLGAIPLFLLSGSEWERPAHEALGFPERCYLVKPSAFRGYLALAERIQALFQAERAGRPVPDRTL